MFSTWCMIEPSYCTEICIDTLWQKFSNVWTFLSLRHMRLHNSNLFELHVKLDLFEICVTLILYVILALILYLSARCPVSSCPHGPIFAPRSKGTFSYIPGRSSFCQEEDSYIIVIPWNRRIRTVTGKKNIYFCRNDNKIRVF